MTTKIEWTRGADGSPGETWNPTTGCDQVSPGCDNCYALTMSARLKAMGQAKYQTDGRPETSGPGFGVQTHPETLEEPLRWRKPRRVFVDSMSDLFHPGVPDEFIADVFAVMNEAERHVFQILTKRPTRARALLSSKPFRRDVVDRSQDRWETGPTPWPLPNVWLGVSAEDQQRADERIPQLIDTPAAVRFVSAEPLLGPVDVRRWLPWANRRCPTHGEFECPRCLAVSAATTRAGTTCQMTVSSLASLGAAARQRATIYWVIVGGESGPHARPMHPQWVRSLRDQCQAAGVAFFFKQWGAWRPDGHGGNDPGGIVLGIDGTRLDVTTATPEDFERLDQPHRRPAAALTRVGKTAAGRELDGLTWDEFPDTMGALG